MKNFLKEEGSSSAADASDIAESIENAQSLFSQGQAHQALQIVIGMGSTMPLSAELLNFAGVCAVTLKDHEQAETFWRQAIQCSPENAEAYFNLGLSLAQRNHKIEAEQCYRQAITLQSNYPEAYCNLGILLESLRKIDDAEKCYRQAILLNPSFEAAYHNLGNMLMQNHQLKEAQECYCKTISLNPYNSQALLNLGVLLFNQKQLDEAEACYRQVIAINTFDAQAQANLGLLLTAKQQFATAELAFNTALSIDNSSPEIYSNLGNLYAHQRRNVEAEECYRKAITLNTYSATVYCNLGVLMADQHRDNEAEENFRHAININSNYGLARLNLGFLLLSQGRWEEGWAYHESRYVPASSDQETIFPHLPFPQWQGESLEERSLLIWVEQGYGDVINFCRFIPVLKEAYNASNITLVCRSALTALIETLTGVDTLLTFEQTNTIIPSHHYWTFLLSIPHYLRTTVETIPVSIPYLSASPQQIEYWAPRLPTRGLRVGLVWKGNPFHDNDFNRSLPHLSVLAPLWSIPEINFISLQKGQGEDEAQRSSQEQPILDLGLDIKDFSDAAAIIQQLDLVICVDTAIAHLAGALGKPCWIMLPAYKTDWRWLRERIDSPWYPNTMRLFRQFEENNWELVIADIKTALLQYLLENEDQLVD